MRKLIDVIDKAVGFFNSTALIFMFIMLIFINGDILSRLFFKKPIAGSLEIVVLLMVCMVYMGVADCALKDAHIRVDAIKAFPKLDYITNIVSMFATAFFAWKSWEQAIYTATLNVRSTIWGIPQAPFKYLMGFGFLLLFIAQISLGYKRIIKDFLPKGLN